MKPIFWIVIDGKGRRLCKDKKFRDITFFGSYPETLKQYRSKAWAVRQLRDDSMSAIPLYNGDSIDACGKITRSY